MAFFTPKNDLKILDQITLKNDLRSDQDHLLKCLSKIRSRSLKLIIFYLICSDQIFQYSATNALTQDPLDYEETHDDDAMLGSSCFLLEFNILFKVRE